ncbi:MAG: hypothetical protein MJB14_17270 [Spirochaetes bacterium]|nr:hypothetical protein [Spirochaetota bacterium]
MEESNFLIKIFTHPFAYGLYVGLLFSLFVFIRGKISQSSIKKELKKLKDHLHTKLEIDAESLQRQKGEYEKLKTENENLRVTNKALNNKPGNSEIRQLTIYQKAIDIMSEKAPGFAGAWQNALRESEEDYSKTEKGLKPLIRKIFPTTEYKQSNIENNTSKES